MLRTHCQPGKTPDLRSPSQRRTPLHHGPRFRPSRKRSEDLGAKAYPRQWMFHVEHPFWPTPWHAMFLNRPLVAGNDDNPLSREEPSRSRISTASLTRGNRRDRSRERRDRPRRQLPTTDYRRFLPRTGGASRRCVVSGPRRPTYAPAGRIPRAQVGVVSQRGSL